MSWSERFDIDALTFKALCALRELADQARDEPLPSSHVLRFVLAYLHAASDAPDWLAKQVWRELREGNSMHLGGEMQTYSRRRDGDTAFQAFLRHCGYSMLPEDLVKLEGWIRRNGAAPPSAKDEPTLSHSTKAVGNAGGSADRHST